MKRSILTSLLVIVGVAALTVAVVFAWNVTQSDTQVDATTNCTPQLGVNVGQAANFLAPGITQNVPVTVTDNDNCGGLGVVLTSAVPSITTAVAGCGPGRYTVGPIALSNVPDGGTVTLQVPVTLNAGAPPACIGAKADLTVVVTGTVP